MTRRLLATFRPRKAEAWIGPPIGLFQPERIRTTNLRLRRPSSENQNGLEPNDLGKPPNELGVTGECATGIGSLLAALDDTEHTATLHFIAGAWPHLPPHIRASVLTLIEAALSQQTWEGGQS